MTFSEIYSWYIQISHYGSLEFIIDHAFNIRVDTIGKPVSIFPTYLTYTSSLTYSAFALCLVYYEVSKHAMYIFLSIWFFILIILSDLLTFGRIGILYGIFTFIGYLVIYNKLKINLKNIILFLTLFFILILPRLIRGSFDNMESTANEYLPYFSIKVPSYLYSFISVFIYYFSSIYAFDSYLNQPRIDFTYGFRMFTPIFNIIGKIFNFSRINTIDPMAKIPFDFNVYTVIKDMYSDFAITGVTVLPFIIGYMYGFLFKKQSFYYNTLKAYFLGWLFFTPIFNIYSFGGFVISFLFLYVLTFTKELYEKD